MMLLVHRTDSNILFAVPYFKDYGYEFIFINNEVNQSNPTITFQRLEQLWPLSNVPLETQSVNNFYESMR
jgi:hypothetical protein